MLEKILKKLGYIKADKEDISEDTKRKLKKMRDDFTELMTYSFEKSVKGAKHE